MKFRRFELALLILAAAAVLFTAGFLIGRHTGRVRVYVTGPSAAPAESAPAQDEPDASASAAADCRRHPLPVPPREAFSAARPLRTDSALLFRIGGRFP